MPTQLAGFLPGSRASMAMDLLSLALVVVLPVLTWSVWLVRTKRAYSSHKRLQVALAVALALAVTVFEIDVRVYGWEAQALPSPYYETWLFPLLYVHLVIAVTTTAAWILTVAHALRRFSNPPRPGRASVWHKRLGWTAALGLMATAGTGWTFYWAAFVATR